MVCNTADSNHPIPNRDIGNTGCQEGHIGVVNFRPGFSLNGMQPFESGSGSAHFVSDVKLEYESKNRKNKNKTK